MVQRVRVPHEGVDPDDVGAAGNIELGGAHSDTHELDGLNDEVIRIDICLVRAQGPVCGLDGASEPVCGDVGAGAQKDHEGKLRRFDAV